MSALSIINGPNLNLLGTREAHHYGTATLETINNNLCNTFKGKAEFLFFQSNHEGAIIDHIQGLKKVDGIVINPGAFTHTSVAIRDALLAINLPFIEVHISNVFKREEFRKHSYLSDIAIGVISGLGILGYQFAVTALLEHCKK